MNHPRLLRETHREGAAVFYHHAPGGSPEAELDSQLDDIVETLCELLEVDYAGVHLLDARHHITRSSSDRRPRPPMPRSDSICAAVLDLYCEADIIEVPDAAADPALRSNEFVDHDGVPIRFYAAAPFTGPDGIALGTLCVIARHPHALSDLQRRLLLYLGHAAAHLLTSPAPPP